MRATYQHVDFRLLERLRLIAPTRLTSPVPGPRLGSAHGASTEFVDYRPYTPGDDVRAIDWNVYARLGKRFVRLFRAEAHLDVHILLDTSNSMRFGSPTKLACAKGMVAALSYVGLRQMDRVGVATFGDGLQHVLPPQRGPEQLARLFARLDTLQPGGTSDLNRAFRDYAIQATTCGLLIIVSDFFALAGYQMGLHSLLSKKFRIVIMHVVDAAELQPEATGSVILHDLEDTSRLAVTLDADVIRQYRLHMGSFITHLQTFCRYHRLTYVQVSTSLPFAAGIMRLQQAGVWYHFA